MGKKTGGTIILSLPLVLLLSSCRGREPGLYRLIDHFEKRDVLSSPLTSLERYFPQNVQIWRENDFQKMKLDSSVYWAASPAFPLAAQYDFEEPPDTVVLREGRKLDYSQKPLAEAYSWRWLKGEKRVKFEDLSKESGSKRSLILKKGGVFETTLIVPPGTAIIKISARSGGPGYSPCLEIALNDHKSREFFIGQAGDCGFTEEMKFGENKLRFAFLRSSPSSGLERGGEEESVSLDLVTIKVLRDLILISPPQGQAGFQGTFELRYIPEPVDKIIPVRQTIENSKPFLLTLDFESAGKKTVQILSCPSPRDGFIKLEVDDWKAASKIPVHPGMGFFVLEVEAEKPRETVRMVYEPERKTQETGEAQGGFYVDSIIISNPVRERYLPLYRLQGYRLYDLGAGQNPYSIKKKFKVRGQSINCLFAPPPSVYKFVLKVPEGGKLRLGYGLLTESWENEGDGVTFEILFEKSGETKLIHRARVDPHHQKSDQQIFYKDFDLSPYENGRLTVYLRTEGSPPDERGAEGKPDLMNDFSFWVSPLLVKKPLPGAEEEARPNVILISIDTVRSDHLSCYGYERPTSPNIDELARDSALFLNTFSPAPFTLPAHMSMLTGLVPTNHQVNHVYQSLNPDVQTLADVLRAAGYLTASFTDGAFISGQYGFSKGFEFFHEEALGYFIPNSAELLYKKASAWIRKYQSTKFFLFLHTYQCHEPYQSPPPFGQIFLKKEDPWKSADLSVILGRGHPHLFRELKPSERENLVALYDGEIRYTDESLIKPLINQLKQLGLYEGTMIVLTSDHGEEFFEHKAWEHCLTLYNEEIKVPLIIKYPRSRQRGKRVQNYAGLIDILPTVLEETRANPSGLKIDGESLSALLNQKSKKEKAYMSFRDDNIVNGALPKRVAIIRSPYKFVLNEKYPALAFEFFSPPPPPLDILELYNLSLDRSERRNLAGQERNLVQEMMRQAEAYLTVKKAGSKSHLITLDKSFEENLRALGYLR